MIRTCEVCGLYPIERRLMGDSETHYESTNCWLARPYCSDECKQVYAMENRWNKVYERMAKEFISRMSDKIITKWLTRPIQ